MSLLVNLALFLMSTDLITTDSVNQYRIKDLYPRSLRPLILSHSLTNTSEQISHFPEEHRNSPPRVSTDSIIRNDYVLNDDSYGGCAQRGPKITLAPDGRFVICWYEFRNGDADIWYQLYDSSGIPLGVNERVNTDATMSWQGDPATACDPMGNFVFTWEDRRQLRNSDIFAQRIDRNGRKLGNNFRINDSTAAGDQCISAVSFVHNGIGLVVWDDRRNGITGDIYGRFLAPDGSLIGNDFRINDDPLNYGNQYEPDIGSDDSNRFVIVWMDGRDGNWNIYGQRFSWDGSRIDSNFRITAQESIQWSPRVAVGRGGKFVVTWNDRRRNQWDIYAQIYNEFGMPVDTNFRVNRDISNADQLLGDVAINSYGEFIIVWSDKRDGNDDVYAQIFDPFGGYIGNEFKVNDDTGNRPQISPAVTALPDGGYYVVWADARNGHYDIYCQRLARDGSKIGANFRVNDDSCSSHQRVSSICLARSNMRILAAWEDERNGNCDIYATVIDRSGMPILPNFRVNDDPLGAYSHFYPSCAGGNRRFLVTWYDSRQGGDIYAQFFSDDGTKVGNNFVVNENNISASQWYPTCGMDTCNRAVIVWMDYRHIFSKIYIRLYDENGNPTGFERRVTDTPESIPEAYASVAMNTAGYWVVTWIDYRNGDADIYCQLFTPEGEKIGYEKRVNSDERGNLQLYPACAIDANRNIAVVWEDKRHGSYDVYLQRLDSLGNFVGDNERVNENPPGLGDCYSPSCAFDETGRLAVVFVSEAENYGNPQIICQRIRPDGTRIGHNQKINEPNSFPNNSHWTIGQSVVANNELITFAWTDNRRHQGWDICAKVTDWNLIGIDQVEYKIPRGGERLNTTTFILNQGVKICLPVQSPTAIKIYSISGSIISELNEENRTVTIDNKIAPGVYFLNLRDKYNRNHLYKLIIL